jgi:hypothetical protein
MTSKKNRILIALSLLLLLAPAWAAAGTVKKKAGKFKPTRPYVEGEVIVQFKDGPESMEAREANAKMGGTVLKVLKKMNLALIQLPPAADTVKAVEQYRKLPGVVTAEPNYVVSPVAAPAKKAKKKK